MGNSFMECLAISPQNPHPQHLHLRLNTNLNLYLLLPILLRLAIWAQQTINLDCVDYLSYTCIQVMF